METSPSKDAQALLANAAWVRRLARSLVGDVHLAEEVAQDALAAAWARNERIGDVARLRRWLAGATRQLAARARWRERERPAREARAARAEASPDDAAERLRAHRRVVDALLALEEPYRQALVLRFFDDLPAREIARRLDIRPELARQRISRGLAKLRARLDEVEGGRAAWAGMLAPLAGRGAPTLLHVIRPEVLLMSAKVATVAVGLVVATGFVWWLARGGGPGGVASGPIVEGVEQLEEDPVEERAALEDSRRSAADESAGRGAAIGEQLAILVLDEVGSPVPGAEVLLVDADSAPPRATTDAEGRARFEAADVARSALVRAPGFLIGGLTHLAGAGEHPLMLIAARTLDGRLLEDGAPPASPLRLRLQSNGDALGHLPAELHELAAQRFGELAERDAPTDAHGHFRFDGLAPDWSGKLLLPSTHWFLAAAEKTALAIGDEDVLLLPAPMSGIELATTRLATLRGRVVWADGSGPVIEGRLFARAESAGGRSSFDGRARTDFGGRFEFGLAPGSSSDRAKWKDLARRPALERVTLWLQPDGGIERKLVFAADELGPGGDVGEFAVERARSVHFVVRDPGGEPVAEARVLGGATSEPTDADGRGLLLGVASTLREVLVGAPDHRVLRLPLGPGGDSLETPVVFVLPRGDGNVVALILRDESGEPPEGVRVELASALPIFEGAAHWYECSSFYWLREGHYSVRSGTGGGAVELALDEEGRGSVACLRDAAPLTARVLDRAGRLLMEESFDGPSGGTLLTRTLVVPGAAFDLGGRVVDVAGAPLANVRVRLRGARWHLEATTGNDGRYLFERLRASSEPCALEAVLRGCAARRVEGLELRSGAILPELTLERGRSLRVRVVDPSGAPVDSEPVAALALDHATVWSVELEPGLQLLEDLPPGRVTLSIWHGWRTFRQPNEPGEDEARFELPVLGTLALIAPEAAPRVSIGYLFARVTAVDDPEVTDDLEFGWSEPDRTRPIELLPGTYRVQLVHRWVESGERREQLLQRIWRIEAVAGQNASVQL